MNDKFKIGSKVKCIKKPPRGHYIAEVGQVLTVANLDGDVFSSKETYEGSGTCKYSRKFFKLYIAKNVIGGTILKEDGTSDWLSSEGGKV